MRALAFLAAALLLAPPAMALDPCAALDVPQGFRSSCETSVERHGLERTLAVTPDDMGLAVLNRLSLSRVAEPVGDPARWLQELVAIDVSLLQTAARDLLESASNPLAGSPVNRALLDLVDMAKEVGDLPLRGCEEPRARRDFWEMPCSWGAGSVRQHLLLRLVEAEGEPFLIIIHAADERRLRHLRAIANSFSAR